ncbi:beta-1,4-galactosyltransferase 4-like [Saccostrea echinata]|uniref:beta-1,4-galactosyltransferase 4-like n=1 Tax=Saccostrea echinata TaxID=191078 RepID=UPI002A7EA724|nr:beta-1,4-galactosyltransferase 4-like [Saccostrea echinata]
MAGIVVLYAMFNMCGIAENTLKNFPSVLNSSIVFNGFPSDDEDKLALAHVSEIVVKVEKSLHFCPQSPPHLEGKRKLDIKPCILAECNKKASQFEDKSMEMCNLMLCNKSVCAQVKCAKSIRASSVNYTNHIVTSNTTLKECHYNNNPTLQQFQRTVLRFGGQWKPPHCIPVRHIAIIIPFRDRDEHLCILLKNLIPMLMSQLTEFRFFVIEQTGNGTFNKGRIMNAGFLEAMKTYNFDCVIFHDVDLIPEHDGNLYDCGDHPRHLSVAIDKMSYKLMYSFLVGGVLGFRPDQFRRVNGYSNAFWGWGGEDDDMALRITYSGLRITRPPATVARYKMLTHAKRKPWNKRVAMLRTSRRRMRKDGVNSVPYKIVSVEVYAYYTKIEVDVGKQ